MTDIELSDCLSGAELFPLLLFLLLLPPLMGVVLQSLVSVPGGGIFETQPTVLARVQESSFVPAASFSG